MEEETTRRGRVVVGVDGSDESYRALDRGAELAAARGEDLLVAHAHGGAGAAALREELAVQHAQQGSPHAQGLLDLAVAYAEAVLFRSDPALRVTGRLHLGSAAGALREESRRASVVVVGSRRHGGLTGLLLGSVAVPLSAHADCPVVVVRGDEVVRPRAEAPVVVGVDGTSRSVAALRFAAGEAERLGCPVLAVTTWDETWVGGPEVVAALPCADELREHAARTLAEAVEQVSADHPGLTVAQRVEQGPPAHVLLGHARDARMVVVGSRGRGGFIGLLLGSTSQTLLHRSPVDVAVVRHL